MPTVEETLAKIHKDLKAQAELAHAQREAAGGSMKLDGPGEAQGMGSMAEDWQAAYPDLEPAFVHAIRKYGENHGLSDTQVREEFFEDTRDKNPGE